MNLLTISSLYPNHKDPKHGIFVQNRLRKLLEQYPDINASVIAPVPWFPIESERFPEYSKFAGVKSHEVLFDIDVAHPKYLVIPKLGMWLTPFFMAFSLYFAVKKHIKTYGRPDIIDGHYFYPDGVAIAIVSKLFKIPYTCTSRGTDLNLIAESRIPRKMIRWVIKHSSKTMAVCQALTDKLTELGAQDALALRNGVDLTFFSTLNDDQRSANKEAALAALNVTSSPSVLLLSVGWLIERKGHHLVIDALSKLPDAHLLIAGNGPEEKALKEYCVKLGLHANVSFLGSLSQTNLKTYYQIADALVLASSREGWANVLLESMACGTPVVATNIWGTPEVVQSQVAGQLVTRDADAIAMGVKTLLSNYPSHFETRQYAEQFDWTSTSKAQYELFCNIKSGGNHD